MVEQGFFFIDFEKSSIMGKIWGKMGKKCGKPSRISGTLFFGYVPHPSLNRDRKGGVTIPIVHTYIVGTSVMFFPKGVLLYTLLY